MKKIEYQTPEVKIVKMLGKVAMLAGSSGGENSGGTDDPEEFSPELSDGISDATFE